MKKLFFVLLGLTSLGAFAAPGPELITVTAPLVKANSVISVSQTLPFQVMTLQQQATPSNPSSASYQKLYFKSDGKLYSLNSSGVEVEIGSSTGIQSLNGLTQSVQLFANGTSGTSPAFVSLSNTHTLNIPLAATSGVTAGLISKAQYDTFAAKQDALPSQTGHAGEYLTTNGSVLSWASAGAVWGLITGTLSNQTDLQAALDLKAPLASPAFTGQVTINGAFPQYSNGSLGNIYTASVGSTSTAALSSRWILTSDSTHSASQNIGVYGQARRDTTTSVSESASGYTGGLFETTITVGSGTTYTNTLSAASNNFASGVVANLPRLSGAGSIALTNAAGLIVGTGSGATATGGTNKYGIYVNNLSGATNNYAIYTGTGKVRIGDVTEIASPSVATGTSAPDAYLKVKSDSSVDGLLVVGDGVQAKISAIAYGTSNKIRGYRATGTAASPTATTAVSLSNFEGYGYDGTAFALGGYFQVISGTTWTGSDHETYLVFGGTAPGSTSATNIGTWRSTGITAVGLNLSGLTASTVPYLDSSKNFTSSAVTPTQLGYLSGASGTTGTGSIVFSDSPTFTTTVLMPSGSGTVPGWQWAADADGSGTGMLRGGANILTFMTNGGQRGNISAAGAWTIGTSAGTQSHVLNGYLLMDLGAGVATQIYNNRSDAAMYLVPDTGSSSGGQLRLFGSTHATLANIIQFTVGTTVNGYVSSGGQWNIGASGGTQNHQLNGYLSIGGTGSSAQPLAVRTDQASQTYINVRNSTVSGSAKAGLSATTSTGTAEIYAVAGTLFVETPSAFTGGIGISTNGAAPISFVTNGAAVGNISSAGLWTIGASGGSSLHAVNGRGLAVTHGANNIGYFYINSTSNTSGAGAALDLTVAGASANDPFAVFQITSSTAWSHGLDNSDSDSYVVSNNGALGSNNVLRIEPTTFLTKLYGHTSIGTLSADTTAGLKVAFADFTGTTQYGARIDPTFQSGATSYAHGLYVNSTTANSSFTLPVYEGIRVAIDKGASATVTRVANYRAIVPSVGSNTAMFTDNESFSGDYVLHFASSRTSQLAGSLGIGGSGASTDTGLRVGIGAISAASEYGIYVDPLFNSAATSSGYGIASQFRTANSSFTMTRGYAFTAASPSKGAASTVTYYADYAMASDSSGGTNNAYITDSPTWSGNFALLLTSTRDNRFGGELQINTAGKGLSVKEGSNARMGLATLVGGTVTVSTTAVTANSRIFLTSNVDGGTPGDLRVSARSAATSFTITSSSGTDTSQVAWFIVEPL